MRQLLGDAMIVRDPFRDPAGSSLSRDLVPPPPADTDEHTYDLDCEYALDEPVFTWIRRQWTTPEIERRNRETILGQALLALEANASFLQLETLTNAQIVAQVKSLTRQTNKIIRLVIENFGDTE